MKKINRTLNLELLYLEGCTAWHQALENLRQALQSQGMALKDSLTRVVGARHARALRLQGCPAIRLGGKDLFPEMTAGNGLQRPAWTNIDCRLVRYGHLSCHRSGHGPALGYPILEVAQLLQCPSSPLPPQMMQMHQ